MASQERLNHWILQNAERLNLRVKKLDWIKSYFSDYTDLEVSIEIGSQVYIGRGTDKNKDIVLQKAVVEAIERFVCRENMISSIGVAGHLNLDLVQENAYLEFVERSLISFHFNEKIKMSLYLTENVEIRTKHYGMVTFKINHFQMMDVKNLKSIFTLAIPNDESLNIGGVMGAASHYDLSISKQKSLIECLRNLTALSIQSLTPLTYDEFYKIKNPTSNDSQRLLFDKSYSRDLLNIFLNGSEPKSKALQNLSEVQFKELSSYHPLFQDVPLKFVQCLDKANNPAPDTEFVG